MSSSGGALVGDPEEGAQVVGGGAVAVELEQLGGVELARADLLGGLRRRSARAASRHAPGLGTRKPSSVASGALVERPLARQARPRLVGAQHVLELDDVRGRLRRRRGRARRSSRCGRGRRQLAGHPLDLLVGQPQAGEARHVEDLFAVDHRRAIVASRRVRLARGRDRLGRRGGPLRLGPRGRARPERQRPRTPARAARPLDDAPARRSVLDDAARSSTAARPTTAASALGVDATRRRPPRRHAATIASATAVPAARTGSSRSANASACQAFSSGAPPTTAASSFSAAVDLAGELRPLGVVGSLDAAGVRRPPPCCTSRAP